MATSATFSTAGLFADGATVGAYPKSNWTNGMVNQSAPPVGTATATGTVANGSVTISGLANNTEYVAAVAGGTRYVSISTRDFTPSKQLTGADIEDASIGLADVAPEVGTGRELGYAEITTGATSTSTVAPYTDVTGLAVTVTVGSRPINVLVNAGSVRHSVASGRVIVAVYEGTTRLNYGTVTESAVAARGSALALRVRLAPSAGSHTYRVTLGVVEAGTATMGAGTDVPASIQVIEA